MLSVALFYVPVRQYPPSIQSITTQLESYVDWAAKKDVDASLKSMIIYGREKVKKHDQQHSVT